MIERWRGGGGVRVCMVGDKVFVERGEEREIVCVRGKRS